MHSGLAHSIPEMRSLFLSFSGFSAAQPGSCVGDHLRNILVTGHTVSSRSSKPPTIPGSFKVKDYKETEPGPTFIATRRLCGSITCCATAARIGQSRSAARRSNRSRMRAIVTVSKIFA